MIFLEDLPKSREATVYWAKGKPYPKAVEATPEFGQWSRSFPALGPGVESAGSGPLRPNFLGDSDPVSMALSI